MTECNTLIELEAKGAFGSGSPNGFSVLDFDTMSALYDCRRSFSCCIKKS